MKYLACCYRRNRRCDECDKQDAGIFNRIDCGCVFEVEIGEYESKSVACLVAANMSKRKGTWRGGLPTGHWSVETKEEGTVAAGVVDLPPRRY